ncbi:MAG: hypothetical protein MPN21_19520 [Thermoanaerobaculia bacterium]|nr:hypothetical protein [Thermoanaerobaculia bacterium]
MTSRQIGPLRFEVTAPSGWRIERDPDPLAQPFLSASTPAEFVVPLRVDVDPPDDPRSAWDLALATSGWQLETGASGCVRWTLPDPRGSFLWRATVADDEISIAPGNHLIDAERKTIATPLCYPLDQLLAIHMLAPLDGLVLHSAGWAHEGRALVVAGVSGAGKTTISRLLRRADPDLLGLSDDRILIARPSGRSSAHTAEAWKAWGTPWAGEGRIASPESALLVGLVFLEHDQHEVLDPMGRAEALHRILPTASVPWYDPGRAARVLETLGNLVSQVPAFLLRFRPNQDAAALLVDLLRELRSDDRTGI